METQKELNLSAEASRILNKNWRESFTVPSSSLYPFQWLWDSGFNAMGWANIDLERARTEIKTLLSAQWKNGLIPHITFHNDSADKMYFPGAEFHGAYHSPNSPDHVKTTGMTQPPVLGFVLEYLYEKEKDKSENLEFYKSAITSIISFHRYLYTDRDPYNEGLVYIRHNWESGSDNSAVWDDVWKMYQPPVYNVERKDTTHVDQSQRPTKRDYDYYLNLIDISKQCNYDEAEMFEKLPFLIQDPMFNGILAASNQSLIKLCELFGMNDEKTQCEFWHAKTTAGLNDKLYDASQSLYRYYDLKNECYISMPTAMGFTPIMAGSPTKEQAAEMAKKIMGEDFTGPRLDGFLCPSLAVTSPSFEHNRYWRGPVWLQVNWILERGFRQYGFNEVADRLKQDSLSLVQKDGFYEYFNPKNYSDEKGGYGGNDFSWTAAVILDFINE
ncbi:MGH1-like glycoside hydrolase domain-containing protein [Lacihabitans lacunae]|uniref:Trehalase family glycosidase n=1 Tax=Lacihabitans lacunae TaxID=1028214 RepID=A0ABV7YRP6_9BACT